MTEATTCPTCGRQGVEILYGDPSPDAIEAEERGELVIGGCLGDAGRPAMACTGCGTQWGELPALELPTYSPFDFHDARDE